MNRLGGSGETYSGVCPEEQAFSPERLGVVESRLRPTRRTKHPAMRDSSTTAPRHRLRRGAHKEKASLKRGLQRKCVTRDQVPKNSHSRSITGIGTPSSQSKSPRPIDLSLSINLCKGEREPRSIVPACHRVKSNTENTDTRPSGDGLVAIARKRRSGNNNVARSLTNDRCWASSSTARPMGEVRPFATVRSSADPGSGRTPSGHRGAGD